MLKLLKFDVDSESAMESLVTSAAAEQRLKGESTSVASSDEAYETNGVPPSAAYIVGARTWSEQ